MKTILIRYSTWKSLNLENLNHNNPKNTPSLLVSSSADTPMVIFTIHVLLEENNFKMRIALEMIGTVWRLIPLAIL